MADDDGEQHAGGAHASQFVLFRRTDADPAHIEKLRRLILQLVSVPGQSHSATAERVVDESLEEVMRLPAEKRSLDALRVVIGRGSENLAARLGRWCAGGSLSWVFQIGETGPSIDMELLDFDVGKLLTLDGKNPPISLDDPWIREPIDRAELRSLLS